MSKKSNYLNLKVVLVIGLLVIGALAALNVMSQSTDNRSDASTRMFDGSTSGSGGRGGK